MFWRFYAFFVLLCIPTYLFASFEIAEVMPNTSDDINFEYITLKNISSSSQSLSGYMLEDASGKRYTFTWTTLLSKERKQFFRPQTKIILNNTDESLKLFSHTGAKIDEISYMTSTKGIFLNFEDIEIVAVETYISGEVYVSDEVILPPPDIILPPAEIEVRTSPEVRFLLQRPSYVTQSGSSDIYICDPKQTECKVNFDLTSSFSADVPERNYVCEISFWSGNISWEENKCNPNTVNFPAGTFEVEFRIRHKQAISIFSKKKIQVIHNISQNNISESGSLTLETSSWVIIPILSSPEIILSRQIPSYITQSGSSNMFICDPKQSECKVNFDLRNSFSGAFLEKDYLCEIDFGFWIFTGEENKCNPNTVIFPLGISEVQFRIFHKNNHSIFSEKNIQIYHFLPSSNILSSGVGFSILSLIEIEQKPFRIAILSPEIQIQKGLTGSGTNFFCEKELCKANLKYKKIHSLERCFWNFGEGITGSEKTNKSCNPGIVTFWPGIHELFLKVYESSREKNAQTVRFFIHNLQMWEEILQDKKFPEETFLLKQIFWSIKLQGKLSKEKIISENKLFCNWVQKCFVNLEGVLSEKPVKGRKLRYVWLRNGEVFSEKLNPSGLWIQEWSHEILFQVYETDMLQSEVRWNIIVSQEKNNTLTNSWKISQETAFLDRNYSGLIFWNILPNPKGNDIKEFIEIKNSSWELRRLGGCFLADSSKKYILPDDILEAGAWRYLFRGETGITLGNSKETLSLSCGGEMLEVQSFERSIKDDELISGEIFSGFSLEEVLTLVPKNIQEKYFEKSLLFSFLILKRDGLKISGTTFPNTKIDLLSEGKVIMTFYSDTSWKFLLKTKDIFAGEHRFDIRLSQGDSNYMFLDFKNLVISPAQRSSWFQKAVRKKKTAIVKIPKLLVSREIPADIWVIEPELSTQEKILFLFLVCVVGILVFGHIFFLIFPKKLFYSFAPSVEMMRFQTRQKLVLLGV